MASQHIKMNLSFEEFVNLPPRMSGPSRKSLARFWCRGRRRRCIRCRWRPWRGWLHACEGSPPDCSSCPGFSNWVCDQLIGLRPLFCWLLCRTKERTWGQRPGCSLRPLSAFWGQNCKTFSCRNWWWGQRWLSNNYILILVLVEISNQIISSTNLRKRRTIT